MRYIASFIFLLGLFVFSTFPVRSVADNELETVQDCKFFSTRMVMSTSSGALGHIISGRLEKKTSDRCFYDVRLYLGGQLVMVKDMRDYELTWAPEKKKEQKATTDVKAPDPQKYVEGLDFGK